MSFFSRLLGVEGRGFEAAFLAPGAATDSGVAVTPDQAMRLSAVWSCVRLLADTISTLPLDVYRDGKPITTPPLLVEPAAGQPRHDWLYSVMVSLLLRGNAFGLITARSGATLLPSQIELVDPDKVQIARVDGVTTYRIAGVAFDAEDVWHCRAYPVAGQVAGLSPVEYARQSIGLGIAAEKFGAQFFGGGSIPSGVLQADVNLTPDAAESIGARWRSLHEGRHRVAVLSKGLSFQPISVVPEESQFIETQRFSVSQIARIFGVPAEMIGGDSGGSLTYSNTEARALDFMRYSVAPWLVRLEASLSKLLPRAHYVKFNPDALLRATTSERYAAHKIALDSGFLTIDEVRALENLPPIEGPTHD
ncbi:phage portal protein [Tessaracoccus sp. Y1736]